MNVLDDGTDNVEYECINQTILDVNVMNTYLINIEGNYGAIDAVYSTCNGCYIIILSSSAYTLQTDLNKDCQFISSSEMVFGGTYYLPININSNYYISPEINPTTQLYL